jgi:hypothetical protein
MGFVQIASQLGRLAMVVWGGPARAGTPVSLLSRYELFGVFVDVLVQRPQQLACLRYRTVIDHLLHRLTDAGAPHGEFRLDAGGAPRNVGAQSIRSGIRLRPVFRIKRETRGTGQQGAPD